MAWSSAIPAHGVGDTPPVPPCRCVDGFLPASLQGSTGKYFPAQAGIAVIGVVPDPGVLAPWTGVLLAYTAGALLVGGLPLSPRDA